MSLCREWTLVKNLDPVRYAKPLKGRAWSCDLCAPDRRRQLMALAAAGEPIRFLTLTVNPRVGTDQADRLRMLADAWRTCVKRLRRRYVDKEIEYLAVVEETKQGEPHLHILLRSPYIPQAYLSHVMAELLSAPVVDIRRIRGRQEVVRYVAKYITKAPKQFGNAKRYWTSQNYALDSSEATAEKPEMGPGWKVVKEPLVTIIERWLYDGYLTRHHDRDVVVGTYSPAFMNGPP